MKRCPKCGQTYNDGSLNFCLMDGAPLVETGSEPTVVIGNSPSSGETQTATHIAQRRSSMTIWIVLLVLIILLGGGAFIGLLVYLSRQGDHAVATQPVNVTSPSPKHSPTPRPSPSPSTSPSATPVGTVSPIDLDDGDTDADELTPIAWNTSAASFNDDIGLTYSFQCPPNGSPIAIWGSDVYTADSSICTAAVHAGLITLEDGGVVTIEIRPGRKIYGSTARNGITSNTFGEYPKSFVFKQ